MPVLQKRINKETFGDVVEKVSSKLAGWKRRFLSLAGRITLTKSVLASIPVHTMSTIALPVATLDQLDKIARSFIWGSNEGSRKQHLLSWEKICRPKCEGGLGIRLAKEMNIALLAKLGWRLLNTQDGLWVKILRKKFHVGEIDDPLWLQTRGTWSPTWRSVMMGLCEVVIPGMAWVTGDGGRIRLWRDRWLLKEPLSELSTVEVPEERLEERVHDLWQTGTCWIQEIIEPYMSEMNRLRLASVVLDEVTGARDRMSWGESKDGLFTVKSAYTFLTRNTVPRPNMEALYRRVWSVINPERVRVFLWLVTHQVIMTNMERKRRHLSENSVCPLCKGGDETILHVLRECPAAAGLWIRLVPRSKHQRFFTLPLLEWLFENLAKREPIWGDSWPTLFALTVWWCWKWRCGYVFGDEGKCRDRVQFLRGKAREVVVANDKLSERSRGRERVEMQISWQKPPSGWIKLNTDGAAKGNLGLATAGGILRDEYGMWHGGFALNIGICSAPMAELWGVYYGLCMLGSVVFVGYNWKWIRRVWWIFFGQGLMTLIPCHS